MAVTILVVEDEEKIARFLELELKHEGYGVDKACNGREGLEKAESGVYDLMILDVMLPELNGFEVLRRLRKSSPMPVIMLTARDAVMDKVAGLDGGADDYMTKPFAIEELLARIRLALKKKGENHSTQPEGLCCGCLMLDPQRYEVHYGEDQWKSGNGQKHEDGRTLAEGGGLSLRRHVVSGYGGSRNHRGKELQNSYWLMAVSIWKDSTCHFDFRNH